MTIAIEKPDSYREIATEIDPAGMQMVVIRVVSDAGNRSRRRRRRNSRARRRSRRGRHATARKIRRLSNRIDELQNAFGWID